MVAATPAKIDALTAASGNALASAAAAQAGISLLLHDVIESLGRQADPVAGNGNYHGCVIFGRPAAHDGKLTKASFWNSSAAPARITKWARQGSALIKTGVMVVPQVAAGHVVLTPADFGTFTIEAGELLGLEEVYQSAGCTYINMPADAPGWYRGQPVNGQPTDRYDGLTLDNLQAQLAFEVTHQEPLNSAPDYAVVQNQSAEAAKVRRPLAAGQAPKLLTDGGYNHGLGYGQSNSIGAGPGPVVTVAQPYANPTFGSGPASGMPGNTAGTVNTNPGTTTIPLREFELNPTADGTHCYESFVSGENNWMTGLAIARRGYLPASHICFGSTAGHGSFKIENLSKGAPWYAHLRSHVTEARARAAAAGVGYALQTVSYIQGEASAAAHTTTASYLAQLRQLVADINTDLRADAGGQVEPVHMLLAQTASPTSAAALADLNRINLAQVAAALADPLIHFVTPMFPFYFGQNGLHLDGVGHLLMGRYFGRARFQLVHEKREPDWMRPVSATLRGLVLTVRWEVPHAPIVLDDALAGLATDFGLRVQDDTGQIALAGIAVGADGTSVTTTLARAPAANPVFRCGLDYLGAGMVIDNGSSNNVRDSTPDTCMIGAVTHRMCHASPAFQLPVLTLET